MKGQIAAFVLLGATAVHPAVTWMVAVAFIALLFFYVRLRRSDPISKLAEERSKRKDLEDRIYHLEFTLAQNVNEGIRKRGDSDDLLAKFTEMQTQFSKLSVEFEKQSVKVDELTAALDLERKYRSMDYDRWKNTKA